jgi:hypothetical protein
VKNLVSKLAFKCNLYRYTAVSTQLLGEQPAFIVPAVGPYTLNPVDP